MQYKKFLFYLLCLFLIFFSGCTQEIKNIDSKGRNIICFGDSITAGSGAGEGEDYPSLLAKELSLPVINAGSSGETTFGALKRLQRDVLEKDPLLVIVEFGGNDFLQKIPPKKTFDNLDKIVTEIQNHGAIVVIAEVRAPIFMNEYKKGFRIIAKKRKAVLMPNLLSGILDHPSLKSGSIHPNKEGYKIISERVLDIIQPIIQENRQLRNTD
ncbi:MAG: arylesterase [Candidatus Omnitrophica bacterium]|nr:arylesterase [Candidatus Omnitrophota bacterium]